MRPARYVYLVDKAIAAAISAIEVYNKPAFRYREETFSILMLNSWELLLKARILKENNNKLRSIEVWENARNKSGLPGKKLKLGMTAAGLNDRLSDTGVHSFHDLKRRKISLRLRAQAK